MAEFAAGDAWVIDGNYSAVQDLVWARADTVVWLDPSRARVMRQLVRRTLRRMARRTELWNGNRESWSNLFRADPEESILRWAWTQHADLLASGTCGRSADPALARTWSSSGCAARPQVATSSPGRPALGLQTLPARRSGPPRPR